MAANPPHLSSEKQTLLALRALRQRVEELERRPREPIAIVGMACRFPGGADSPLEYWNLLAQGRDAVIEIPRERMHLDPVFDSRPQTPGKTYSRWAGLLHAAGDFDAEFFGISPREAPNMDPQQRLLLEASWEALEDAGMNPRALGGIAAGVFVGISASEYAQLLQQNVSREQLSAYMAQGSALNATAGRISYFYGLNGPSMAIDTACSSSLVAVDRACRSLREGETELAIAAGVNIVAAPDALIVASQWGMLSASGKVRAFDASADGFVRGEGCGVLVLKRVADAERDGDRILGVILGSAVNQDGASSGLTVPNGLAQQALLREAHRRAGIEPWQVGYVEAHGTGTALGDPIEAEALGAVFGEGRARERKLPIGSVKTNVGHLESAAGVAGLIKIVLGLGHGVIPAQLNWERPSEHVRWSELPLEVVTEARAWEPIDGRRIGGVSSFGFSGTNAHVVVEGWVQPASASSEPNNTPREEVLVITARSMAALRALAERYAALLHETDSSWSDVCYTAAIGRAVFAERLALVAAGKQEAAEKLLGWLRGESRAQVFQGEVSAGHRAGSEVLGADASNETIAAQFVRGATVDWMARSAGRKLRRVGLPTYAFQRERYWIEAAQNTQAESGEPTGRALLGRRLRVAGVRAQFASLLRADSWIGEHVVEGRVVLPATGHLELMLEAGAEVFGAGCALEDVVLESPLIIDSERGVQTVVEEESNGRSRVRIYAEQGTGEWERVSEGWLLRDEVQKQRPENVDVEVLRARLQPREAAQPFYAEMSARGLEFGARFRGVERLWSGDGEALGEIAALDFATTGFEVQPWWLDACLQVAGAASSGEQDGLYLPMSVGRLDVYAGSDSDAGPGSDKRQQQPGNASRSWSHITTHRIDTETLTTRVTITDEHGVSRLRLDDLRFRKVEKETASTAIYAVEWIEAALNAFPQEIKDQEISGHWAVLSGADNLGAEICTELRARGARCSLILAFQSEDATRTGTYVLGDAGVNDIRKVLREITAASGPLEGLLDLRSLDAPDIAFAEESGTELALLPHLDAALSLLQGVLLEQASPARVLWLITRSAGTVSAVAHAIRAFRRTAALEFPDLQIKSLELDFDSGVKQIVRAIGMAVVDDIKLDGDRTLVPRLVQNPASAPQENTKLVAAESGLIEEIKSIQTPRELPKEDEIEIEVHATGVNFRDVMNSLGMLPGFGTGLGGECSGVVVRAGSSSGFARGERVFAFAPGSFKRYVTVKAANAARVPEGMSLAQAAGLPVVYLTALFGFHRLARMKQGESVLIHSAAGGLGLAAIYIARHVGVEIYATAGSEDKRDYLRALGVQHVFSSRTPEFSSEILRRTNGRGVDVVLNSLTGALAEATLSVLAVGGRFLEVGKRETLSHEEVLRLRPDVRHFIYDLGEEAAADASLVPALIKEMLHALGNGDISPLPVTEFTDAKEAFRFMAQARHVGKIVVTRTDVAAQGNALRVHPKATYLITGGCGGLGQIFAERLVKRGARHLVLMGRSDTGGAAESIERMRALGASVCVATADVADTNAVQAVLEAIPATRPLKGILHAAGVLSDHSLLELTPAAMRAVLRPKWQGAWNLHRLTRDCELDFFVMFSSAAALLGSPGQANYAAANATLDALATYRHSLGLPALSIQWGPWNAAGMTGNWNRDPYKIGLGAIEPMDGLDTFEALVGGTRAVSAVLPVTSWRRYAAQLPAGNSAFLSLLTGTHTREGAADPPKKNRQERFHQALQRASASERRAMLMEHLRQQTLRILSLSAETRIDENEALHDLGLDSLMAVELRNSLMVSLDIQLSPTLVLDYPTLRSLTDFLLAEISEADGAAPAEALLTDNMATVEIGSVEIEKISEEEAEALLLQELGKREHGAGR